MRDELQHALQHFPTAPFVTVLPDAMAANRVTERMSKRADPGPRVVVRRQDTPGVLMVSELSLSKAKGLDLHPSHQTIKTDALDLFVDALALPGLAVRGAVTWTGAWAKPTLPDPAQGLTADEWLNVHGTMAEAQQRLLFLSYEINRAADLGFVDSVSGHLASVQADDAHWLRLMDALEQGLPDDGYEWAEAAGEASSSVGSSSHGLLGDPTEDRQPDPVFVKPVTPQALPPAEPVVNPAEVGHTDPDGRVLPTVERTASEVAS